MVPGCKRTAVRRNKRLTKQWWRTGVQSIPRVEDYQDTIHTRVAASRCAGRDVWDVCLSPAPGLVREISESWIKGTQSHVIFLLIYLHVWSNHEDTTHTPKIYMQYSTVINLHYNLRQLHTLDIFSLPRALEPVDMILLTSFYLVYILTCYYVYRYM